MWRGFEGLPIFHSDGGQRRKGRKDQQMPLTNGFTLELSITNQYVFRLLSKYISKTLHCLLHQLLL